MKQVIPATPPEHDPARVIERPDGFYRQPTDGIREYGPFKTLLEASEQVQFDDQALEPCETLEEAEAEIGIAEWIDPETGDPAEEERPRIEEH